MKKIVYILFFASVLAACEGPESETEWNRVNGLIARHGNFDPSVVPALLTGNMLSFAAYFELETEKLYYSDQVDMSIGGVLPEFLFFEDGTCWECWLDMAQGYDGGLFYRAYNWRYDPQTQTLVTRNDYTEARAVVRAVDGGDMLILDGDLCSQSGARIVFKLDPNPDRRADYLENCRNIADFESAE